MTDRLSQVSQGNERHETIGMPVRLVRGDASPEELAALVAILATARGDVAPDLTDGHPAASGRSPQAQWSSPRRMTRTTHTHGPGGWRASALPR